MTWLTRYRHAKAIRNVYRPLMRALRQWRGNYPLGTVDRKDTRLMKYVVRDHYARLHMQRCKSQAHTAR